MTGALAVDHINKSFGDTSVLRNVSLSVASSEMLVLLGPSGCGKTTLLRTIAGLERPDAGTITLNDTPLVGSGTWVPPEARGVGMVFQDWALFPHLSVAENVAYGLPRGERPKGRRRSNHVPGGVQAALDLVDMGGFAQRMPDQLSGGPRFSGC